MVPAGEPIRVLRVIARLNVGGPALHVVYLSSELDKMGYETILATGRVGAGEGSMERVAEEYGVVPHYITGLQREIEPFRDAAAIARLLRIIREFRPHVLHTHTAKAGALGRMAVDLAGGARPQAIVHTYHGHVLRGYFKPALTATFRQVERRLAVGTDALIAVSPEVRDDLVELGIAPAEKIRVIRLGLDLAARTAAAPDARVVERRAMNLSDGAFVIGWLGRMTEIKRVDDLIRSFALVREQGVDAHLALVGDGPLRESLEAQARELGVAETCRFLGYREDVGSLYRAFDVVALTSANEGTPVTLIEALAAGLPAVATDVGGVKDVVEEGRTGFLVPPGDCEAIAARLVELAEDSELRRRFSEAGGASVADKYSIQRLAADTDALYRELLAVRAPRVRERWSVTAPIEPSYPPAVRTKIVPATDRLRVILVSQYFPPEVGATQSRMQSFAEYLAARGHRVTVISEFPNHPRGVIPEEYRGHLYEDDRSNEYRVLRVRVKTSVDKNQATRLALYGTFTAAAMAVGPMAGKADIVLATSPPLFTGLAGVLLARMNRAPFVLDVRDLWPAAAEALEQITSPSIARAARVLEHWLYRQSTAIVAVTQPFCAHIDRIRGRPPETALIPNGTLEMFFEGGSENVRASLGIPDDVFLATFAGTHGIAQSLPTILDAARQVDGSAHFLFVGEGPLKHVLEEQAQRMGLENVHFHRQVPTTEIVDILASSDALLVPLSGHPVFADFVPSKLVDFMAVGKPVILSAHGESARLLDRAAAGVVVRPDDPAALAEAVTRLAAAPEERKAMGERGQAFARTRLRSTQAERLELVLRDLVAR